MDLGVSLAFLTLFGFLVFPATAAATGAATRSTNVLHPCMRQKGASFSSTYPVADDVSASFLSTSL